ncbi:hypothetical protein CDAR_613341 [Caerostris darwini]|uniref:Uncharacterized protein n=1 Tax=Caerostris darwini TaxID=1538125 RepID=A0AAV4NQN5_9ARAC|nr:hypothetical protein CDAR_613341 [Caerostris darwini]
MCEHDKLHIRNLTVDWTSTAYYDTFDIHHHRLPSQFVRHNSMDRAHTPALDRPILTPTDSGLVVRPESFAATFFQAFLQPSLKLSFTYLLLHLKLLSASSLLLRASSGGSLLRPHITSFACCTNGQM